MLNILNKLNPGKIIDNVLSKIDDSSLTPQEKADSTKEFVKETLSENSARSIARRFVAKMVIYNYFALLWVVVITFFYNSLIADALSYIDIEQLVSIIVKFQVPFAFIAVITFFFGGYYLTKNKKNKEK